MSGEVKMDKTVAFTVSGEIDDDKLPAVVGQRQLKGLGHDGRPCEICHEPMADHKWAVLDINGFSIFCSNLTYKGLDDTELHYEVWYVDEEEWESPAGFISQRSGNPLLEDTKHITARLTKDIKDGVVRKAEVCSYQGVAYIANKVVRARLGNWDDETGMRPEK